jgi:hypothetical protein
LIKGHGATDSEPLRVAAAKFLHKAPLRIGFYPLCNSVKIKALRQQDDGRKHILLFGFAVDVENKRAINFHIVNVQLAERIKWILRGAEIIKINVTSELGKSID